jgi:DNA excision repair protein ERCC-1
MDRVLDTGNPEHCSDAGFHLQGGLKTVLEVSKGQHGNVLLRHLRNTGWTFGEAGPDFLIGERACVIYISLKYHLLHPEYVKARISELQYFNLCVVLCLIDAEEIFPTLQSINRVAGMGACPLICVWSAEEAARYVELCFSFGYVAQERAEIVIEVDYMSKLTYFLGGVRGMKSIEAASLCAHFGTLSSVLGASIKAMLGCPGFGQMKACRLHDILIARWQTLGQPA